MNEMDGSVELAESTEVNGMKFPTPDEILSRAGLERRPMGSGADLLRAREAKRTRDKELESAVRERMEKVNFQLPKEISAEFRNLLLHYAASYTSARMLSEVDWRPMATRLGTELPFIVEAAAALNSFEGHQGAFWSDVIGERIKRAGAAKLFRDVGWEKLESKAVMKLLDLAERGLIRDVGELLAVAKVARQVSSSNLAPNLSPDGNRTSVQVNIHQGLGVQESDMTNSDGLPGVGAKMTIDLSPRSAKALEEHKRRSQQDRVIDGEMLNAEELRSILNAKATVDAESEGNS